MKEIVSGIESQHVPNAFLAALSMYTDAIEVLRYSALEQSEMALSQSGELVQRFLGIRGIVSQPRGPQILVVSGDRRTIVRQDHAQAPSPHDFGVGKMTQYLPDGPFVRGFTLGQLSAGQ